MDKKGRTDFMPCTFARPDLLWLFWGIREDRGIPGVAYNYCKTECQNIWSDIQYWREYASKCLQIHQNLFRLCNSAGKCWFCTPVEMIETYIFIPSKAFWLYNTKPYFWQYCLVNLALFLAIQYSITQRQQMKSSLSMHTIDTDVFRSMKFLLLHRAISPWMPKHPLQTNFSPNSSLFNPLWRIACNKRLLC